MGLPQPFPTRGDPKSHTFRAAVAPVPDALDLPTAATVGINGLAASQLAELLGDGPGRLLITGAAGTGGAYLGVRPGMAPAAERDITVDVVETRPDTARLAELLDAAARGVLPTRVHAVVPLSEAAAAHRAVAKGGVRGKYVLAPWRVAGGPEESRRFAD
ncbi:zinc-binding dehydrogenase [Nocardia farcinica]|uniref:Uncharacterized protein n=1 Tax=Nocardia farcinica (strain IFM 10152) TaxID=247156 RepID=Q5YWZ6_NOCFA|nr:zinc-binding dehydrogenase [Nocardia farcinica]BAD57295.1 hypothetical protein NFA_24480 [Nocardia farcinica IFM 10152]